MAGPWLKQSTAVTIKFGPFVDSGDGNTDKDGLTIQKADVRLSKNGGNIVACATDQGESDAGAAHDEIGYYDISLGTGDTDTLGRLKVMVHKTGALHVWEEYMVVPANVWDSMFGADALQVDLAQVLGTALTETSAGYLAAGIKKLFDVETPVLTAASVNQTGDAYAVVNSGTYGNSALKTIMDAFATDGDIAEAVRDITLAGAAAGGIGDALVDILAAAVTNGVLIAAGAIKGVSFDASTAFPLAYVDSGATKVARTGADGDTLETLSDEIATEYALVSKWILNKLVRTDNLDGTITYRLYDDNSTDILKTWVYTTATTTRGKAS